MFGCVGRLKTGLWNHGAGGSAADRSQGSHGAVGVAVAAAVAVAVAVAVALSFIGFGDTIRTLLTVLCFQQKMALLFFSKYKEKL